MKRTLFITTCLLCFSIQVFSADLPAPLVSGLKNPESVCLGKDGRIYVTEIGEFEKDGDGQVSVIVDGKAKPFATGLDDPKGIVAFQDDLYVTDKTRVVKVDAKGQATTFIAADKFPSPPLFLNDIAVDPETGTLFVSDSGDLKGKDGKVFRIQIKTGKVELIVDSKSLPELNTPNGLLLDGKSHLLLADFGSGALYRIKLEDLSIQKIDEGFDGGDGLTWDKQGQLFITSWKTGKVMRIPHQGEKAVLVTDRFEQAADSCLDATGRYLLVPDMKAGTLTALPVTK
jgi:sugar lactone lactonase YvrE